MGGVESVVGLMSMAHSAAAKDSVDQMEPTFALSRAALDGCGQLVEIDGGRGCRRSVQRRER
jgi:hypothetical protein